LLLLIGYFVPLGLTLLGPVLVNILLFHTLLEHGGLVPVPLVVTALYLVVFAGYRNAFAAVLKP
jgi:putative oxidoreductase